MTPPQPARLDEIDPALWEGGAPEGYPEWFRLATLLGSRRIVLDEEDDAILSTMWAAIFDQERRDADQAEAFAGAGIERPDRSG